MKKLLILFASLSFNALSLPTELQNNPCVVALCNATQKPISYQVPEEKPSQNSPNLPSEPRTYALLREVSIPAFESHALRYSTSIPLRMIILPNNTLTFDANGRYIVWISGNPPYARFVGQEHRPLDWYFHPKTQSPKKIESFNFLFSTDRNDPLLTFEEMLFQCEEILKNNRIIGKDQEK